MLKKNIISEFFKNYFDIKIDTENIGNIKTNTKDIENRDIFVAIRGGNDYIEEALERGASLVVYDRKNIEKKDERYILVEDSIKFLQEAAKFYRKKLSLKVIGITGSNGKTTTKDVLYMMLKNKYKVKKTEGNLNNHIGVPITLLNLEETDEIIVLEMGMSGFGEIDLLSAISKPDYGIITNIGDSHLEYLKTKENIFKAKTEMLPYIKEKLIINGDDFYLKNLNGIKIGYTNINDIYAEKLEINENGTNFDLYIKGKKYNAFTNLIGVHNISDIMLAFATALELGIKEEEILEIIKNLELSKMRFQKIEKGEDIYINDAYNASPVSMRYSIESFDKIYNDRYKIAILGDMLELGEDSKKMHEDLYENIKKSKLNEVYLYGKEMKFLYEKFNNEVNIFYFNEKKDIKSKLEKITEKKAILLKGSRGMKLEEII